MADDIYRFELSQVELSPASCPVVRWRQQISWGEMAVASWSQQDGAARWPWQGSHGELAVASYLRPQSRHSLIKQTFILIKI